MPGRPTGGAVSLRPLTPADLGRLLLWLAEPEVARFYAEPADPEHVSAKFGPRARGEGHVRARVIRAQGRDIGYGQFYLLPDGERRSLGLAPGRVWGGFDLFIADPAARGLGLGRCAVAVLLAALREQGAQCVAVDTWTENRRALHLYASLGLRLERRLSAHTRVDGAWRDHWLMVADLADEAAPPGALGRPPTPDRRGGRTFGAV